MKRFFPVPDELKKAWFNFQVNEFMAYHSIEDFKSEASKILFTKAWMCTGPKRFPAGINRLPAGRCTTVLRESKPDWVWFSRSLTVNKNPIS